MKMYADLWCQIFGFSGFNDFLNSMFHMKLFAFTLPLAALSALVDNYLGISGVTFVAFFTLLVMELVTGLVAARAKGQVIESKKFPRFILKLFVWLGVFFIVKAFAVQYADAGKDTPAYIFSILHTTLMIYVTMEYLISVLENLSVFGNKSDASAITFVIKKIKNILGMEENEYKQFFDNQTALLCTANHDGKFIKLNKQWEEVFGYTINDLYNKYKLIDLVHPDDVEFTNVELEKCKLDSHKSFTFVNRLKRIDDTYIRLSWSCKTVSDGRFNCTAQIIE